MAIVLITDDAAFTRRMLRKALLKDDHVVIEAANGIECLEMIETHAPECILLDLLMPELDGFGVLKALSENSIAVPVVILSADIQDSVRQDCMDMGAFAMLKKPPKEEQIREIVKNALAC